MAFSFRLFLGWAVCVGCAAACESGSGNTVAAAGSAGMAGTSGVNGSATGGSSAGGSAQAGTSSGGSVAGGSHAGSGAGGQAAGGGGSAGTPPASGAAGTGAGNGGVPGDGGAGPGGGEIEACLDSPVKGGVRTEALSFVGDGVEVGIVRRIDPDGVGTSGTTIWLPQSFGLVRGAVAACVADEASLSYQITHHNFDDSMSATSQGETWTLTHAQLDYGAPQTWSLDAKQGQNVVWGPVALSLKSCLRLDNQQDCTAAYQP
ncbi:MAG TPA: hypothetical protein VHB79_34715 [Polyangiaceae bacterium]|nr:hypothetical protein [Polyangiaceae bacterium]